MFACVVMSCLLHSNFRLDFPRCCPLLVLAVLQRHKANLRHTFFAYCHSWPFGVSAHLAVGGVASGGASDDGGMTRDEFWRLLQDIGMAYTVRSITPKSVFTLGTVLLLWPFCRS
eukprot:SAG31_NODE_26393_length_443_cov_0.866279_1_plen_115_part_00